MHEDAQVFLATSLPRAFVLECGAGGNSAGGNTITMDAVAVIDTN